MHRRRVVIVGAGPAGAAAAIAARRNDPSVDVVLLDSRVFPRDKACGDGVAGHVFHELALLDIEGPPASSRPATGLTMATRRGQVSRNPLTSIYGIPRRQLDAWLVAAAVDAGARLETLAIRSVCVDQHRVVLNGDVEADVCIGADGVESVVRGQLGLPANPPGRMALALRGYAPSTDGGARLVSWGRGWPAYAWEFPLGNGTSNIGYGEVIPRKGTLTRQHLLDRLDNLLPGMRAEATGWRGARIPLSTYRPRQPDGRVLLAGDAASLVNPMSGEGIWYAVRSGRLAGEAAVRSDNPGADYRDALRRAFDGHLRHANLVARVGALGSMAEFGTRMTGVHEPFFHDQVAVSIGGGRYSWPTVARAALRAAVTDWPRDDPRA